jgi:Spy/CpxP family protein refolding chaperone
MSLKTKLISVFGSAIAVATFAVAASAQDTPAVKEPGKGDRVERKGPGHRGGREGFRGMRGFMGVELTEAQKAQIKQIHEANRPDEATRAELKAIHEARRNGTITDDQKARARARAIRDQMRSKHESVRQQVLAVLTPEQRQQIETRKAEMQKRMEERRQMRQRTRPTTPPTDKSNDN